MALIFKDLVGQVDDAKLDRQRERLGSVGKDERYLKKVFRGKGTPFWPFKGKSILISEKDLNMALEVRDYIKKNNGFVSNVESMAIDLAGKSAAGKPLNRKGVERALALAIDAFPELKNFKFAADAYPNIDVRKFKYLEMVAKSFADYSKNKAPKALLPDSMIMNYDLSKVAGNPQRKKGFFNLRNKLKPADRKFVSDRVATLTGKNFSLQNIKETITDAEKIRRGEGQKVAKLKINADIHKEIEKLAKDNKIKNLLKLPLDNKNQSALLARASTLVDGDVSNASRRLFQMAQAMSTKTDKYNLLNVEKNNIAADKLINTARVIGGVSNEYAASGRLYEHYANVIDKTLGAGKGKTFLGYYQAGIKRLLDAGQSPDEIFSVTASAKRGLSPYAIFTQRLRSDVNSAIKGAYIDGQLSTKHKELQEIFQGRTYNQLNAADKKAANALVETFEKTKIDALNKPVNPGAVRRGAKPIYLTAAEKRNIQLPEFDLKNPPSKSIEGFSERFVKYPKLKTAFEESFKRLGYGMKVPKTFQTQKELLISLASKNTNNICSTLGPIKFAQGGSGCAVQMAEALDNDPIGTGNKIKNLKVEGGVVNRVKGAATNFLSLLGKGGMKAAPLAAVAAAGAIAEPLVKQFRNDDPSTYLSNPEQQKGMLLSMLEAETPQVDEEILKWQYPGIAAGAAASIPGSSAMYKARRLNIGKPGMGMARAALGPVGKVLAGSFSPLAVAASLPIGIAAQVKGGSDLEDIATDPFNWMGPAFASSGAELATKGMKPTGILSKALRLGMKPSTLRLISSRFGLPGLALSAGLKGYDIWKNRE